ncbi:hypothetical protein [Corallococcus carmarthensis]|uniref:Uncharacterized protein n=1 Tax=Corallococcus carmarthensis TaxID=2316728 RepID=A0A3A8JQ65_9BACT|nr:hypothetical protein [Corallococcus carmarthensis]NOK20136.1 hypothetical protein [Corallococcus carmarthensis]RKG97138.1 hypothetical protein D7X32_33780 [Corallococcus carmarthensis]
MTENTQKQPQGLETLRTLRDELRLEMHLAGMEVRERWRMLEPKVQEAEQRARAMTDEGQWLLDELLRHMRELRKEIREHRDGRATPRA